MPLERRPVLLDPEAVAGAIDLRAEILDAINSERGLISLFVSAEGDRLMRDPNEGGTGKKTRNGKKKTRNGKKKTSDSKQRAEDITTTAFVLYMLLGTSRDRREPSFVVEPLKGPSFPLGRVVERLENQLRSIYRDRGKTLKSKKKTATGKLPNPYNTAIHLAGLLVAWRATQNEADRSRHLNGRTGRNLRRCARYFTRWLSEAVKTSSTSSGLTGPLTDQTNPYFQYWVYVATLELMKLLEASKSTKVGVNPDDAALYQELESACMSLRDSATMRTAYLVAAHEAGIDGHTDATFFLFTLAIAGLRSKEEHHSGSRELISHGVSAFFARYVSQEGSFYPRPAAFYDAAKTPIVLSTAEHGALLLEALSPYCHGDEDGKLGGIGRYVIHRRVGAYGWGSDTDRGVMPLRTVFVAASALAYLQRASSLIQQNIERTLLEEASLVVVPPSTKVKAIQYERRIEDIIRFEIVEPIARGTRDQAALSLVLHGPPGTSKTTLAERIACDLGWPFIELSPSAFLNLGLDYVEAEADRIFKTLSRLEDKVVLFDEFEEMLKSRQSAETASRFLTTSMLPWLHEIRDRGRIVFIIATNELMEIDIAARRFGRINRIVGLEYPTGKMRDSMFEALLRNRQLNCAEESIRLLRIVGFPRELHLTDRPEGVGKKDWRIAKAELRGFQQARVSLAQFGFGHIKEILRRLAAFEASGIEPQMAMVARVVREVAEHDQDPYNSSVRD
jgi:hypothetical protein